MADSQRKSYNLAHDILIKKNDTSQYWNVLCFDADLEPNTTYTLSIDFASTDYRFYTNGALFTEEVYFNSINGRKSITVTTKSTISKSTASQATDGRWIILKNAINQPSTIQMSNVMINSGSTAKPYEPYGWQHSLRKLTTATEAVENPLYSDGIAITAYTLKGNTVQNGTPTPTNPVMPNGVGVRTANLYNINAKDVNNGYVDNMQLRQDGTMETYTICEVTEYIELIPNASYRLSNIGSYNSLAYCIYDDDKQYITGNQYSGQAVKAINMPPNGKYLRFSHIKSRTDTMLNLGSTALPYEPYGYKIPISSGGVTTNIYLGNTQTVRQIKKLVLTGDETGWTNTYGESLFRLPISNTGGLIGGISSHFSFNPIQSGLNAGLASGEFATQILRLEIALFFKNTAYTSVSTWKTYLQQQYATGTPVIVWYVLETPETAIVNEPLMKIGTYADTLSNATAIPTTEGANSITVDTTVQPSEFTATWTGWHDASVKEWDGSQWN